MKHNQMVNKEGFSYINHVHGWKDVFFGTGYTRHVRVRLWAYDSRKSLEYLKDHPRLPKHLEHMLKEGLPCVP